MQLIDEWNYRFWVFVSEIIEKWLMFLFKNRNFFCNYPEFPQTSLWSLSTQQYLTWTTICATVWSTTSVGTTVLVWCSVCATKLSSSSICATVWSFTAIGTTVWVWCSVCATELSSSSIYATVWSTSSICATVCSFTTICTL